MRGDATKGTEILIVDDDAATRASLTFLLRRNGFVVETAEDGERAWEILQHRHFSLILTDWVMPKLDGLGLCEKIRAAKFPEYTYIILLTGYTNKTEVTRGLEAGADDYISKPADSGELLARLQVGHRILEMQAHLKMQQRQLEELASIDGLTGVLNRRALEARLTEAHSQARRRVHPMSLALLDLDRFKLVNDTHGHQAGDCVLQNVATRVKKVIRNYDSVGRYGGEEFMVLLTDASQRDAMAAAERIRNVIGAKPVEFEGQCIPVTTSIGVATCLSPWQHQVAEIISVADGALYEAKHAGRNRVVVRVVDATASRTSITDDMAAEVG